MKDPAGDIKLLREIQNDPNVVTHDDAAFIYAEQEAIAFAEWFLKSDFNKIDGDYYHNEDTEGENPLDAKQLYQIYQQSKPQQP